MPTLVALLAVLGAVCAGPAAAGAARPNLPVRPTAGFVAHYHPGHGATAPTHADTAREIHVDLAAQVRTAALTGVGAVSPATTQRFLPTTWCGTELTTDDTAHATQLPDEAFYKLVYAYASDEPDRFDLWKDSLQGDVSLIGRFMAQQDGATKSPRFDMGTDCGPGYADIQVVALPGTRAYYADQFNRIVTDVDARIGGATASRNVVVLADSLTDDSPNQLYGLGEHYNGGGSDIAGPANPHNGGDLYAALFPPVGYAPPASASDEFYPGFWPEGMLHEITHTLGAVNGSAPHTSAGAEGPRGHCTDGYDVMCYDDGPSPTVPYTTTACPQLTGSQAGMTQTYDCNRDDYFNPAPAAGSYLATHWNVFNSAFEAPCATLGDACGSDGPAVPASAERPKVTGAATVGTTLTADHGTWSGAPDSYAYRWQRQLGSAAPVDVPGATSASYPLTSADAGRRLRVVVTATNAEGDSLPAISDPTATVAAVAPPVTTVPPTGTGGGGGGTTTTTVDPPVVQAPVAPIALDLSRIVSLKRRKHTVLKVTVTSRASSTGVTARLAAKRVKLRRGSYRLRLCVGYACVTKPFTARRGVAKVPAMVAFAVRPGSITLRLLGPGGTASAKVA